MTETKEGKYLTFALSGEEYGISILQVREIIGMMPITPGSTNTGVCEGGY